jgi:hypothetical protein
VTITVPAPPGAQAQVAAQQVPAAAATSVAPVIVVPPQIEPPDAVVAARLERTLAYYAQVGATRRTIGGISLMLAGAGLGIAGAFTLSQPGLEPMSYTLLGTGLLTGILGGLELVRQSPMERVYAEYTSLLQSGRSAGAAVQIGEQLWQNLADRAHTARMVGAGISFASAGIFATGALVIGLMPDPSLDASGMRVPLTAMIGAEALLFVGTAVHSLLLESEVEMQLRAWRLGQSRPREQGGVHFSLPGVGVTPGGGLAMNVGGRF